MYKNKKIKIKVLENEIKPNILLNLFMAYFHQFFKATAKLRPARILVNTFYMFQPLKWLSSDGLELFTSYIFTSCVHFDCKL